jgi:hypothetical protein
MAPITTFSPQNMAITFPNNFYLSQTALTIGLAVTQVNNLFQQLTYDSIQKLINNVSSVAGVSLKSYPKFSVTGNTIYLTSFTGQLSSSLWTYVLIRGINNPSNFIPSNFVLTYYLQNVQYKALNWIYNYPLNYFISPPPNYLTITSVQVSDYDLLYPSTYTFTFNSSDGHQVATAGKNLSYVIVIPTFYQNTLWANNPPTCKFSSLNRSSSCYSYQQ